MVTSSLNLPTPGYGWVTATKDGKDLLASPYVPLEAGERQRHITLWARRKALDKDFQVIKTETAKKRADAELRGKNKDRDETLVAGANASHDEGGFAFGGVEPGTLHAKGHVVKVHTVRYSIGIAGRYRLHVGLREQSVALPGSPFSLTILPGSAHAGATRIDESCLPLRGVIGSGEDDGSGVSIVLWSRDKMANYCTSGGADVKVRGVRGMRG